MNRSDTRHGRRVNSRSRTATMRPVRPEEHIEAHRAKGRAFEANGVTSFVREEGSGEAVLCFHGVPVSSFLYRKVLPALAARGKRGIAFDFPGVGLADRPEGYDYSWSGLGRFSIEAVDALGLDRFHVVTHDIGGPVSFEVLAAMPERILSLTILNTLVEVTKFTKPWPMRPFEKAVLGELWLGGMITPLYTQLMYMVGVSSRERCRPDEIAAHLALLKRGDGGKAFLKTMRGFETTPDKERLYLETLREAPYPIQALWGDLDTALRIEVQGEEVRRIVGDDRFHRVPAKHFVQESHWEDIAELVCAQPNAPVT